MDIVPSKTMLFFEDDGGNPTSAIEIGTKLVSREAAFKACGAETSPSLDQGDRCKSINQERVFR